MTAPRYNPAFQTAQERALRFAGRRHDLAELLRAVRENTARNHNQHVLLLGPRGMGKTTLLLRAADAVREEAALEARWFPLVAPEELYLAGSLGEVWLELVLQLAEATGDARHAHAYAAMKDERDDARLAAAALAHLLDFADGRKQRLLIVLENLQLLFEEQLGERDAWAFREVLLHEPRIMVLASAMTAFPGLRRPDAALYELFQLHPLDPLDRKGCMDLWKAAAAPRISERRGRALEILTGGNPRALALLAESASGRSLMESTLDLIDAHTDLFKLTTEALPALERKVFAGLAQLWEEASAAQVAREARLEMNVASAQLARLEGRGVVLSRRQGRGKRYRLADGLFSLYHLLRRRSGSRQRIEAALAFMDGYDAPGNLPETGRDELWAILREALDRQDPSGLLPPALRLAALGAGADLLDTLADSPLAPRLEPLLVALRKHLDLEWRSPGLIEAVAEDLLQDIRALGPDPLP